MKVNDLFKESEGMTSEGSTIQQRHEIWKLLFDKKLIFFQDPTVESEIEGLSDYPFYLDEHDELFIPDFSKEIKVINIPFEEFKNRLSQL